jgi:hypothetical protein
MAARQIIHSASPVTRPYFVIGDWVILWCLYNFFRNRDGRRDHPIGNVHSADNDDARELQGLCTATSESQSFRIKVRERLIAGEIGSSQAGLQFYDMIRDRFY